MPCDTEEDRRPLWREPRALALLMAASLTVMANATISPALPALAHEFAALPDAGLLVRLLVTAPSLGVLLTAPLAGFLTDRAGRRPVLLTGIWLFVFCGTAGSYLPDLHMILASRFGLGIAVALIMTAQTALIGDYFSGARRSAMTALQIAARNFGGLVFIGLAGVAATLSARLPFAIYALALVCLWVVWRGTTEPARNRADAGQVAAEQGRGWLVPMLAVSALQLLTNALFFLVPVQLPFYLAANGGSPLLTGAGLALLMLCGGIAALCHGGLRRRLPQAAVFALGYGALAAGFAVLAQGGGMGWAMAGVMLIGAGYATVSPGFVTIALALAPPARRGTAAALLTASVFLGQFLSPLASTPLIEGLGFGTAFAACAGLLAIMALIALAFWSLRRPLRA